MELNGGGIGNLLDLNHYFLLNNYNDLLFL